jgi:ATP-binding cassette subfamily B protein
VAALGLGLSGTRDLVPADDQHARAAPLPRQGHDRARVARRSTAGVRGDARAPGAPEYLDRLSVLRNQVFVLDHMYMSLFTTCGWILRLGVTVALLMSIHPALLALAFFALPTVLSASWRPGVERTAEERGAQAGRLAQHLFRTATTAAPGKEVRVTGLGPSLIRRRREAWERWYEPVSRARWGSALWHALAWALFGGAYVAAVVWVAARPGAGAGDLLLLLAAGARLSAYVGATVGEIGFLRGIWLDGSRRLAWLEDYAASLVATADQPAPARLEDGIRLERVSFAYPGTERLVLEDVDLALPAGAVIALVGENGAGKTTLVKLLCKLYEPSTGRILVDGAPLARMRADDWRARLAGAFQDFFRFELPARHSVGVGDEPRMDDEPAVTAAVARAGADDVVARCRRDCDASSAHLAGRRRGLLRPVAEARAGARLHAREPLLLVLDEPTAALDAETEHALFERYAAGARAERRRRRACRIRPRLAPLQHVRMADLIVVLDGRRVVAGRHARRADGPAGGTYSADLYGISKATDLPLNPTSLPPHPNHPPPSGSPPPLLATPGALQIGG